MGTITPTNGEEARKQLKRRRKQNKQAKIRVKKWQRYGIYRLLVITKEDSMPSHASDESLGPLGKVLMRYRELSKAGKLHFSTPEERQAELRETIANAEAFEQKWVSKLAKPSPI